MRDRLKIAVWYNLPSGGARRALYDQIAGLVRKGHRVEAWTPDRPGEKKSFADISDLVEEHRLPLEMGPPGGRGYFDNIVSHLRREGERLEGMKLHSAACAREIAASSFDLLYAHNDMYYNAPFIGRAVRELPKALYLQEPQRSLYEAYPRFVWAAPSDEHDRIRLDKRLKRKYLAAHDHNSRRVQAREEGENARAYDRILANSYFSRESILKAYGKEGVDVRVCYLGIDLNRFINRQLSREPFVVGVGAIVAAKNLELPIRALATIPTARRPPLVWVGNFAEEPYRSEMVALAKTLHVDLRLEIDVPDERLLDLLGRASAMVYAPHLEPFGYAPLEANACGLGVAAVAEGGVRETVVDGVNGFLSAPESGALGKAILTVMDDPALGLRAERHVRERWGLEGSIDNVERNLYEVVEAHRTTSS